MAYTVMTVKECDRDGPTQDTAATQYTAIADGGHVNGHSFVNDGKRTFLSIRNGAAGRSLYVYIPMTVDGQAVTMQTYTVNANTDYMLGPFPAAIYNQAGGIVHIAADAAGALTYQPWRLR
jgi:hypothetical protein